MVDFSNGNVKVHFRVVVKVDELEDKEPVAIAKKVVKRLESSVKTGQIGNRTVNPNFELIGLYCGFDVVSFAHRLYRSFIH